MKFADIDLSRKLVGLGCVSSSGQEYFKRTLTEEEPSYCSIPDAKLVRHLDPISAFTIADFVDTTEQAKENARRIARVPLEGLTKIPMINNDGIIEETIYPYFSPYEIFRHHLIDSEDWTTYLAKYLEEEK